MLFLVFLGGILILKNNVIIDGGKMTLQDVLSVADGARVTVSKSAYDKMAKSRKMVDEVVDEQRVVYGITTGFGKFSEVSISKQDSAQLQKNLIMSHACGVGEPLDVKYVRAQMCLRLNALAVGNSGVSRTTFDGLLNLLNAGITPYVPKKGSLGASGDLVPLAHMTLTMLGLGDAYVNGKLVSAQQALKDAGLSPVELTSKEGLALINGTCAMCSLACFTVNDGITLNKTADVAASLTAEALRGIIDAYDERIHLLRGQTGQIRTAANLRKLLNGSKRVTRQGELRVQDAYTLRCVPQIHGPSKDAIDYVTDVVGKEINAVTDNPVIFADTDQAISGGNFHGQALSMALDFAAISLSELANVSERRIERMVNPQLSGLPAFLVKNGGLNSGYMIVQYTAASLVNENKVLSHPACVDSITSSANQEDHVSMGMTAARKARTIAQNVTDVLAIELLVACQAIDLGCDLALSPATKAVYDLVRSQVPFMENDRYIAPDIKKVSQLVADGSVVAVAEAAAGELEV
mgnify:FL=1